MSNGTIKYELNTNIFPCINAGMYNSALEMPDDVVLKQTDENLEMWEKLVLNTASTFITDAILESSNSILVSNFQWYHPSQYNFTSDEIDFTVSIPSELVDKWFTMYPENADFIAFIQKYYRSYDGFISSMADNKAEFIEQCKDDPDLSIAQILLYNVKDQCVSSSPNRISDMQEAFVLAVSFDMSDYDFDWATEPTDYDDNQITIDDID